MNNIFLKEMNVRLLKICPVKKFILISFLFFLLPLLLNAQKTTVPGLEKRVNINATNQSIESILTDIGHQAGISFSYNAESVNASASVSLQVNDLSVRSVLNQIFKGTIGYRERGKFLILQPVDLQKKNNKAIVEGYLFDSKGVSMTNASVYNLENRNAVLTDDYGYFKIEIDSKDSLEKLHIKKRGYDDRFLMPESGKAIFVQMELPNKTGNSLREEMLLPFNPLGIVNRKLQITSENVDETIRRVMQLSFLPNLGTNNLLSGCTSNIISLNIIGGYVESVKALELGCLVNMVRKNAIGFQASCVSNFVGGNSYGFQATGILNITGRNFKGVQASGMVNTTGNNFGGVQATGFVNKAKNVNGVQVSGFVNIADSVNGVQIAGIVNKTKFIRGVQFGVVNIADSCAGVPIGLVNIVKKNAYRKLDLYATEIFLANIEYRGGTKRLYSIFMVGFDPGTIGKNILYSTGYGIGTSFRSGKKISFDLELLSQQVRVGTQTDDTNMINSLGYGVDWKISKKLSFIVGLSYNLYLVSTNSSNYSDVFSKLSPYTISDLSAGTDRNIKTWIGLKAGLRLF
jgi:hypothetical protein